MNNILSNKNTNSCSPNFARIFFNLIRIKTYLYILPQQSNIKIFHTLDTHLYLAITFTACTLKTYWGTVPEFGDQDDNESSSGEYPFHGEYPLEELSPVLISGDGSRR